MHPRSSFGGNVVKTGSHVSVTDGYQFLSSRDRLWWKLVVIIRKKSAGKVELNGENLLVLALWLLLHKNLPASWSINHRKRSFLGLVSMSHQVLVVGVYQHLVHTTVGGAAVITLTPSPEQAKHPLHQHLRASHACRFALQHTLKK